MSPLKGAVVSVGVIVGGTIGGVATKSLVGVGAGAVIGGAVGFALSEGLSL